MSLYVIGDVHGCFISLMNLMDKIHYHPENDELVFLGDIVNKGPSSLEVLKWVKHQKHAQCVLGNHELHLLRDWTTYKKKSDVYHKSYLFRSIMDDKKGEDLCEWLCHLPVHIYNEKHKALFFHAALHFDWTLEDVKKFSDQIYSELRGPLRSTLLEKNHQYIQRVTYYPKDVLNIMTRARYWSLTENGYDLSCSVAPGDQPTSLVSWFDMKHKRKGIKHFFGHWASLLDSVDTEEFVSLDGGCVWGGHLVAYNVDEKLKYKVQCAKDEAVERK